MESQTPNYYAVIPAKVRYCKKLPMGARFLYGEITALCNKDGYCWATNTYFAEIYEVSEKTVSLWIKGLIEEGFINSEVEEKYKRKIFVLGLEENVKGGITKTYNPVLRKRKDNNTVNNTVNISDDEHRTKDSKEEKEKLLGAHANELLRYFIEEYEKTFRTKPVITNWSRYNKAAQKYIQTYDISKMKDFVDSYFQSDDKFFKANNYPINLFFTDMTLQKLNPIKELTADDICRREFEEEQRRNNFRGF